MALQKKIQELVNLMKKNQMTVVLAILVLYCVMNHQTMKEGFEQVIEKVTGPSEPKEIAGPGPSAEKAGPAPVVSKVKPNDEEDMVFIHVEDLEDIPKDKH